MPRQPKKRILGGKALMPKTPDLNGRGTNACSTCTMQYSPMKNRIHFPFLRAILGEQLTIPNAILEMATFHPSLLLLKFEEFNRSGALLS
jgi:hypothetical protein